MPKLPFMLSNKDWEALAPREIDKIGKRDDLSKEQEDFLKVFRVLDLRVEWVCNRIVVINNITIVMAVVLLLFFGALLTNPKAVALLIKLIPSQ